MKEKPFALDVKSLTVHYGTNPALWDLTLEVPQGHFVGIMGPNGAGKTTFMKAILGLLGLVEGRVRFLGHELHTVKRKLAYIPQRESVDWDFPLTVRGLVEMGRYGYLGLLKRLKKEDREKVDYALETLQLHKLQDQQIHQLSGGQQQRAFLARSLASDADLYFLDEPFSGVDQMSEEIIVSHLRKIVKEGKTVFVIYHDLVTAQKYFDFLILLNTRLVSFGPFKKVFTADNLKMTFGKNLALIDDVLKLQASYQEGRISV
jgi:manganese/zinc/iron transport system ATP- binding protein